MSMHKCLIKYSAAAAALFCACGAPAQVGVTADKIIIGQSAGFTGSVAGAVKEQTAGAKAYFDVVNAKGGVHGRKIVLESMDDGFDPKRTPDVIQKLIVEKKVFALFLSRGTPTNEAAIPVIEKYKVPLIGPSTGAMSMYEPPRKYLFPVRASYRSETFKIVDQLVSMGIKKIAVVYTDDSFGKDGLTGVQQAMKEKNIAPVAIASHPRGTTKVEEAVATIAKAEPQAVIMTVLADAGVQRSQGSGRGLEACRTKADAGQVDHGSGMPGSFRLGRRRRHLCAGNPDGHELYRHHHSQQDRRVHTLAGEGNFGTARCRASRARIPAYQAPARGNPGSGCRPSDSNSSCNCAAASLDVWMSCASSCWTAYCVSSRCSSCCLNSVTARSEAAMPKPSERSAWRAMSRLVGKVSRQMSLTPKSRRRNRCTRLRARARIGTCGKCLRTTAAVFTEASTSSMASTKSFASAVFAASSSSRREASP